MNEKSQDFKNIVPGVDGTTGRVESGKNPSLSKTQDRGQMYKGPVCLTSYRAFVFPFGYSFRRTHGGVNSRGRGRWV